MWQGVEIKTKIEHSTTVSLNGHDIDDVLKLAVDMAHTALEEISHLRQEGRTIGETEDLCCEGMACRFLDMVGD